MVQSGVTQTKGNKGPSTKTAESAQLHSPGGREQASWLLASSSLCLFLPLYLAGIRWGGAQQAPTRVPVNLLWSPARQAL
jgi:hypothetical protein